MGNWVESGINFPGTPRGGAVCFVIDNKAYVGTGANTKNTEDRERFRDFFYCTPTEDGGLGWSAPYEVAPMPVESAKRNGAVAFALNGKGYVGTGYDGTTYLKDFWEYDPQGTSLVKDEYGVERTCKGKWTRIADYPGDTCRYAVAFVIEGKYTKDGKDRAFVGTGEDYLSIKKADFHSFDGENWDSAPYDNVPSIGTERSQASAFVAWGYRDGVHSEENLQKFGYVAGGNSNGECYWFYRYNALTNSWEMMNKMADKTNYEFDDDYLNLSIYGSTAFVVNSNDYEGQRAYIATGGVGRSGTFCWEYNPYYDYWLQKTSFEGPARKFAVSFTLQFDDKVNGGKIDVPFVTTGTTSDITMTGSGGEFYTDNYYFRPYEPYEPKD